MSFVRASLRLFAGVIVWALHFAVIYGFTGLACARGMAAAVPWAIGAATVAAGAACLLIVGREMDNRQSFTASISAGLAGFALVAIVWEALPVLMVRPCA